MWCTRPRRVAAVFVAALLLPPAALAAVDAQDGLWELGIVMRVEGRILGPYMRKQCVTREDVQNPSRLFAESAGSCEYTNLRQFGNQLTFNVRCSEDVPLSGTGQVEYSADRIRGNMVLDAQLPQGPSVETESEISGKRLGACP